MSSLIGSGSCDVCGVHFNVAHIDTTPDKHVSFVSPPRSPRVANDPVVYTVKAAVANYVHGMVNGSRSSSASGIGIDARALR